MRTERSKRSKMCHLWRADWAPGVNAEPWHVEREIYHCDWGSLWGAREDVGPILCISNIMDPFWAQNGPVFRNCSCGTNFNVLPWTKKLKGPLDLEAVFMRHPSLHTWKPTFFNCRILGCSLQNHELYVTTSSPRELPISGLQLWTPKLQPKACKSY